MSTEQVYLSGVAKWAKVRQPDEKYDNYTIDVYLDDESWDVFNNSRMTLEPKEDEDGRYVRFRRPNQKLIKGAIKNFGAPNVVDAEENELPEDIHVGNGSEVTIRVAVYDTMKGPGHRLEGVKVHKLVEYDPDASFDPEEENKKYAF